MDLRVTKTTQRIRSAFSRLRMVKPLEKITVKELCALAEISKATFYLHYRDLYDLSQQLQDEVIEQILEMVRIPERLFSEAVEFTRDLAAAFTAHRHEIDTLFSGGQAAILPQRIEQRLREDLFARFPEKRQDARFQIQLTFQIQGGYAAYLQHTRQFGEETVLSILETLQRSLPEP